jgi:hypothetical protein
MALTVAVVVVPVPRRSSRRLDLQDRVDDLHGRRYKKQWEEATVRMNTLVAASFDTGNLYNSSYELLLAHEDRVRCS